MTGFFCRLLGCLSLLLNLAGVACTLESRGRATDAPVKPALTYRSAGASAQAAKDPFPGRCDASLLRLRSECACVMDLESEFVLYEKNANKLTSIASITKVMTAMVILDSKLSLDQILAVTADDVDTLRHSRSHLPVGWCLTRGDMIHLALMSSENRAAHALARTWPGGVDAFVKGMNDKAAALGLTRTHFEDPTGLFAGNASTAADLAYLVKAAYGYDLIRRYSTVDEAVICTVDGEKSRLFRNSDRLVRGGNMGIELSKTGYIIEAGYCLVTVMRVNGRPVVCAVLNASRPAHRFTDTALVKKWLSGEVLAAPTKATAKKKKAPAPESPKKSGKKKKKKS